MKYQIGQMVVYEWTNTFEIGVIIGIDRGSIYPYRIHFPEDNDDDWYKPESVDDMVEALESLLEEK